MVNLTPKQIFLGLVVHFVRRGINLIQVERSSQFTNEESALLAKVALTTAMLKAARNQQQHNDDSASSSTAPIDER